MLLVSLLVFVTGLFTACDFCEDCQSKKICVVDTKVLVGKSGDYTIYSRRVSGGTLYEYHYDAPTFAQSAKGFRVVFVADSVGKE